MLDLPEQYADLTARVAELEAERELTLRLAQTDSLTGLVNRGAFTSELCERLEAAEAAGRSVALFVIDLDRFKHLNDTLGHHAGDVFLAEIGERLRADAGAHELVARLGGDEFALISDGEDVARRAQRLVACLARPAHHLRPRRGAGRPRWAWRCSRTTPPAPVTCSGSPTWRSTG